MRLATPALIACTLVACIGDGGVRGRDGVGADGDAITGADGDSVDTTGCDRPAEPCIEWVTAAGAPDGCQARPRGAGTPCDDGDACTQDDRCGGGGDAGRCLSTPVVCTAANDCSEVGTCNPLSGVCDSPSRPDGDLCADALARDGQGLAAGICRGGSCQRLPEIHAGGFHACVIFADDTVRCWGRNTEGQLGLGTTINVGDGLGPAVREAPGFVLPRGATIALGTLDSCVIGDGAARCWGEGYYGVLGTGSRDDLGGTPATAPARLAPIDFGADFVPVALSLATEGACAVDDRGRAKCWGSKLTGYPEARVVAVPGAPAIAEVGVIDVDGGVPFPIVELVRGEQVICARSGVSVRCWGFAEAIGWPGFDVIGDDEPPSVAPVLNPGRDDWRAASLDAGSRHACAIDNVGLVRCWGANDYGQLGLGGTGRVEGVAGAFTFGNQERARKLALGAGHTCVLLNDASVRCWGQNASAELGRGDDAAVTRASDAVPVELGGPVHDLAAGSNFNCVVMRDGAVRCWGSGTSGELGTGQTIAIGDDPGEMPPPAIVFE